ncbi:GDSL-type esterase/lipase family protein [Adhaeribacter radiodurans]|uniref:Sialate O-acetylesterase n=1 Tax=Adhaeribacter radiodurans TaxID=2745197 RepID=A0A7L7LE50_9BACT|nr:GDSL-type esterase/lipase family protein [Adhaeribacter radiodurans]QMU31126.1 sialate O-acetylesterase [Adhaeribacter radiodurans]
MKNWFILALLFIYPLIGFSQSKIKVACVGNSITAGAGVEAGKNYPDQLQVLLGDTYDVENYGISGRTLLKKGDFPYWKEAKYQEVLQWQPDIVVIKLGTNDSKPQNWQHKAEFKKDYIAFVKSFKKLPSHPKVYICKPMPAYYENFKINPGVIKNEILPLIETIAKKTKVKVIDLYTPMLGKDALAPDGIHPNAEGDAVLANEVYKEIK